MAGIFGEFFLVSVSHETKHEKSSKNSGNWAAANGGVTNGGLRGVWPPFLGIGRNRPFSPFFCLFRPFPEGTKSAWEIQKTEEKGLFPQISSDLLKPPSLKPPFAALQGKFRSKIRGKIRDENSKKFGKLSFCKVSDLTNPKGPNLEKKFKILNFFKRA